MESFLPSEIARLVLGYLEEQKCKSAYDTFLGTSINLKECLRMKNDGRKFRTQVLGLSLLDILYEYSAIYSLVQEHLKKVDKETADSLTHSGSLLDKVTFLLNATGSGQTMLVSIRLPPGKSPQTAAVAHVRKRVKSGAMHDRKREYLRKSSRSQVLELSQSPTQDESPIQPSNLDTTTLSSLPGNSSLNHNISIDIEHIDDDITRTPKRKQNHRRPRADSVSPDRTDEENINISVYQQALLDHELHEKIAENINKVIHTPDVAGNSFSGLQEPGAQQPLGSFDPSTSLCVANNFTLELDNAIKTIVHQTETDPVFENFLQEVVGQETSDDTDRGISDTSTPCKSAPETVKKQPALKHRLRSSKKRSASPSEQISPNKIEYQNLAAIESIIAMNAEEDAIQTTTETIQPKPPPQPLEATSVATVDQQISIDTTSSSSVTDVFVGNANKNLVMISQPAQSTYVMADQFQQVYQQPATTDNRFILLSNNVGGISQQIVMQPQFQLSQPTVISEADILAMPTLIMCSDNNQQQSSTYILPQNVCATVPSQVQRRKKDLPILRPKCPKKVPIIHQSSTHSTSTQETDTVRFTISVQAEAKPTDNSTLQPDKQQEPPEPQLQPEQQQPTEQQPVEAPKASCSLSVPMIMLNSTKKEEVIAAAPKAVTPPLAQNKVVSLSTPRNSRSHIRALDFSTPPKESHSGRKASTCPKYSTNKQKTSPKPSCSKSPKLGAKKIRASLFGSPGKIPKIPIATRSPMTKLTGGWNKVQGAGTIIGEDSSPEKRCSDETVNSSNDDIKVRKTRTRRAAASRAQKLKTTKRNKSEVIIHVGSPEPPVRSTRLKNSDSWDEDLRALITPVIITKKAKPAKKTKTKTQEDKLEEGALTIEEALSQIEGPEVAENPEEVQKETKTRKRTKSVKKEDHLIAEESKLEMSKGKRAKTAKKEDHPIKEDQTFELMENIEIANTVEIVSTVEIQEMHKEGMAVEGFRHMKPRVNKKCNVGVIPKKVITNQEECIPKTVTTIDEKSDKVILSPSKMNANKRQLVESEPKTDPIEVIVTPEILPEIQENVPETLDPLAEITPSPARSTCSNAISSAKRNLTPGLETPFKYEGLLYPMTPRIYTPFSMDSPFGRLFAENAGSVDLSQIPTPSLPITPQIVLTPNSQCSGSGYASRPTDYSNSSSYYQPSDSEQTQKLEHILIEECKHLDTVMPLKNKDSSKVDIILNETSLPVSHNEINVIESVTVEELPSVGVAACAHLPNVSRSSIEHSSDSDSTSTSHDSTSDDNESIEIANSTVISRPKAALSPEIFDVAPKVKKPKFIKKSLPIHQNIIEFENKQCDNQRMISKVKRTDSELLRELEEKRKRVMQNLREPEVKPKRRPPRNTTRVTRAATKRISNNMKTKQSDNKSNISDNVDDKIEEKIIVKEQKVARKPKTIESIAARLKKDNTKAKQNDPNMSDPQIISELETEPTECDTSKEQKNKSTKTLDLKTTNIAAKTKAKKTKDTTKSDESVPKLKKQNKKVKENDPEKMDTNVIENKIENDDSTKNVKENKSEKVDSEIKKGKLEKKDSKVKESPLETVESVLSETQKTTNSSKIKDIPSKVIIESEPTIKEQNDRKDADSTITSEGIATICNNDAMVELSDCATPTLNDNKKNEEATVEWLHRPEYVNNKKIEYITDKPLESIDSTDINCTSIESPMYLGEEEIPRLHISSDDDDIFSITAISPQLIDSDNLVKCLKERGIHLVANKHEITEATQNNVDDSKHSDSNKKETTKVDLDKTKKVKIKSNVILQANKKINVAEMQLAQSIVTDTILGKTANKKLEPIQSSISDASADQEESKVDGTDEEDEEFDVKVINEDSPEFIKVDYETTITKCQRKLSDYNLAVLERTISAKVFVDDQEQERFLTITPFFELFSTPPVTKKRTKQLSSTDASSDQFETKVKQLDNITEVQNEPKCSEKLISDSTQHKTDESAENKTECTVNEMETNLEVNLKKRKASFDSDSKSGVVEKRIKPNAALLRTLNVDNFLTKVHGPANPNLK